MTTESKLKRYSLGIVAMNKALDSDLIEAVPIEDMNFVDGDLSDNATKYKAKGENSQGQAYEHEIDTTVTILAKWIPDGNSNRRTPPDVRRGERVQIWQYGDQDKYYWSTLFYEADLRKLETVVYTYSNTRVEDEKSTPDTTYYMEVSTHKKHITLHTSKNDGEPFVYDIQLNTKEGFLLIKDDIGNFIQLDSKNVRITAQNADGSYLDINRKNIHGYAPDTINLTAGNYINLKAGKDINHDAGTSINSKAGQSINDQTNAITTKATMTTNTVPTTSFTGDVNIGKKMSSNGMAVVANTGGGFTVAGNGQFTGQVNVNKLISTTNISAPNVSG